MKIAVQLEPADSLANVEYTWDPDTGILSARLVPASHADGMSGSVGLEGADGSWVVLDVAAGRIHGVEIAVWPDVRANPRLTPPSPVEDAGVIVPARRSQPDIASLEMDTNLLAESDVDESMFHFTLGNARAARTVRIARHILLDVDGRSSITGVWLLNVPPAPVQS